MFRFSWDSFGKNNHTNHFIYTSIGLPVAYLIWGKMSFSYNTMSFDLAASRYIEQRIKENV